MCHLEHIQFVCRLFLFAMIDLILNYVLMLHDTSNTSMSVSTNSLTNQFKNKFPGTLYNTSSSQVSKH